MARVKDYEKQVYTAVLGKVLGVYTGRPFEGMIKHQIEERWGEIDRYVHEDQNCPLVVSDDDISGTFTFVRALEDSGLYEDTPDEFFGDTWLNYLIEDRTVLWWGGMGMSTEHTAYLRLKEGFQSPQSGSVELNGATVAEQIGAQIFIDAYGMVTPGQPELAAKLARRSASVSHGGEAVNGAVVVASMVSAAFIEKNINRLLDIGVAQIDPKSKIAQVHRDVRAWAKKDRDWHKTYERIDRKYGYHKYGGCCHMIPNHAIMVMAWAYAPNDFHKSQVIINTAGWDTDCNAANVGSVMALVVGLDRINEKYDFQSPTADRIWLPTAEGTRGVTDCLTEALHVARLGRKVMGWKPIAAPKKGAWHHFDMPGALHGYMAEDDRFECQGAARLDNVKGRSKLGDRSMRIAFDTGVGRIARLSTPIMPPEGQPGYTLEATPRLYSGMQVVIKASDCKIKGKARARLFIRHAGPEDADKKVMVYGKASNLAPGRASRLTLDVPDLKGWPVEDLGIEITSDDRASGELFVDAVTMDGKPRLAWPGNLPMRERRAFGWIYDVDFFHGANTVSSKEPSMYMLKNEGPGVAVTGNLDWTDYTLSARIETHLSEAAGILVRYQGLQRYIVLVKTPTKLQLVMHHYGDHVLDEIPARWKIDEGHDLSITVKGKQISASCDGKKVLKGTDDKLGRGGAGAIVDRGRMLVWKMKVK
jgi:ADP-ribosylglycohydrolase